MTSAALVRREFLRNGLLGITALMARPLIGCSSDESSAASGGNGGDGGTGGGPSLTSNVGAIGPLGEPDANGIRLPEGFTSRILARSGEAAVPGKSYVWHDAPDGGATFATEDGGWIYVSNSETFGTGGAGALRFDAQGNLVDSYPILSQTNVNCAGGKTPWGTWLSCEEVEAGRVWECDPTGATAAVARPALGVFAHEAVAVDPEHRLYLSEDRSDGRFYRFVPDSVSAEGVPDLSSGTLQVAQVMPDNKVIWHAVPDPQDTGGIRTRQQVAESTEFKGGEGVVYSDGIVYLATKGDNRVWAYDVASATISVLYDAATAQNPILSGVDNLTVTCCGDVLVAEDDGDMQVVVIQPDGSLKALLEFTGHAESEVCGIAFDPSGKRLYLSSQRGTGAGGITYEISGPFHLGG